MADTPELFGGPPAVDQSGNLTIWATQTIADMNAPTLVEIGAATRITYSFTPGGWNLTVPQERNPDPRLTSTTNKESLGATTPSLADLAYVDSDDADSAAVLLADGGEWYFLERRGVPQTAVATAEHKVRVIKTNLGVQIPGPVDGNGKFGLGQAVAIDAITLKPVSLV